MNRSARFIDRFCSIEPVLDQDFSRAIRFIFYKKSDSLHRSVLISFDQDRAAQTT
jgi:hypothetical protein